MACAHCTHNLLGYRLIEHLYTRLLIIGNETTFIIQSFLSLVKECDSPSSSAGAPCGTSVLSISKITATYILLHIVSQNLSHMWMPHMLSGKNLSNMYSPSISVSRLYQLFTDLQNSLMIRIDNNIGCRLIFFTIAASISSAMPSTFFACRSRTGRSSVSFHALIDLPADWLSEVRLFHSSSSAATLHSCEGQLRLRRK